jgi:hypothetical protein
MPDSDPRDTPAITAEYRETLGLIVRMEWGPDAHRDAIAAALAEIDRLTRWCQVLERDIDEGAGNAERLEAENVAFGREVERLRTERDAILRVYANVRPFGGMHWCYTSPRGFDFVHETELQALECALAQALGRPGEAVSG